MTQMTDPEMSKSLSDLYCRTGSLVLNRCRLILKDDAEAEDAMQEVFLRIIKYKTRKYKTRIDEDEITLAWLFRTAERCCFNRLKKRKKTTLLDTAEVAKMVDVASDGNIAEQSDAKQIVLKYLGELPPKLAQLALLYFVDELSQEEIGKQLGWSRRTIGKKLKKLREKADKMARNAEK